MKIINLLLIVFFLHADICLGSKTLDLEDILAYAQKQTSRKKIIAKNKKKSLATIEKMTASAYPHLSFSLASRKQSYPPGSFFSGNSRSRSTRNAQSLGLDFSGTLYSFGRLGALWDGVKASRRYTQKNADFQIQSYYYEVITLYCQNFLAAQDTLLAQKEQEHMKSLKDFLELEYQAGARGHLDYLRVQAQFLQAEARVLSAKQKKRSFFEKLQILASFNGNDSSLKLDWDVANNFFSSIPANYARKIENIKSYQRELKLLDLEIKKSTLRYQKAEYYPSLSFQIRLSTSDSAMGSFGAVNLALARKQAGFNDLFDQENLNASLALNLSWSLFDGFYTASAFDEALADKSKLQLELREQEENDLLLRRDLKSRLITSQQTFMAQKKALEAMNLALKRSRDDFKFGNLSLSEYLEVQREYVKTRSALAFALTEKILVYAEYKKTYQIDLLSHNN